MRWGWMRTLLVSLLALLWGEADAQPAGVGPGMMGGPTGGVQQQQLAGSVHRTLGCVSCHGIEHAMTSRAAGSCQGCHQQAAVDFTRGPHGTALRRGDTAAPTCVSCHGSHGVQAVRDPSSPAWAGQTPITCGGCHRQAAEAFVTSVHGHDVVAGKGMPTCATCHGAHTATPIRRDQVAKTCGTCHIEAHLAFQRSVHGTAVARVVPHAPTCTGCHGVHTERSAADPTSPTAAVRVAGETCARCHGSVQITAMHNLPTQVVEDFRGSFHGLAAAAGDRRVANCASCHGYHEIRPSSSPFSSIHPANLGRTCGQCHPGAGARFAQGGVHHTTKTWGHRLVDTVGSMYAGMIVVVVGLMAIHNGVDFQRRRRDRRRRTHAPDVMAGPAFLRFTVNERLQHWLAALSFVTLVCTGFALRLGWRLPWIAGEMQQITRATIHRSAAVLFMGLAVYHLGYLVLTTRGREMARAILPRVRSAVDLICCGGACMRLGPPSLSDWRELLGTLKYNLGLTEARPAYGRFAYWEKMEYWALAWGTIVMVVTGLVLWFETPFLNRFPYWALDLFRTVHFYEAILATLAIVVWHLYATIVNPEVFPLNQAMTRGTLTYEEMRRDHPRDLPATARRTDHETDDDRYDTHPERRAARDGPPGPDRRVEPGPGPAPGRGATPDREAHGCGDPPQTNGGHQRS